jgi:origin recognition complex subunit 4
LPQPAVGVLIISKHLAYAGREEFNFAQVEEEYLRFSRTKLVGSGKTRWPVGVLRIVSPCEREDVMEVADKCPIGI